LGHIWIFYFAIYVTSKINLQPHKGSQPLKSERVNGDS
jgi:hypothetical protein